MDNNKLFEKGIKYEIFIGLKDKDSYIEILDVNDFKNIITQVCTHKQLSFSMMTQLGGYTHNKGYTTETSLRIIIIGIMEKEATVLGEKLKEKVNTDLPSVLTLILISRLPFLRSFCQASAPFHLPGTSSAGRRGSGSWML